MVNIFHTVPMSVVSILCSYAVLSIACCASQTKEISGIKIFRFEAPLYFANADFFVEKLRKKTGVDTSSMKMDSEAKSRLDKLDSNYAQVGDNRCICH